MSDQQPRCDCGGNLEFCPVHGLCTSCGHDVRAPQQKEIGADMAALGEFHENRQPTAQESERAFEEWHPTLERHGVYCHEKCLTVYRRGRAEEREELLRGGMLVPVAELTALRAENARLWETLEEANREWHECRDRLVAAEQEREPDQKVLAEYRLRFAEQADELDTVKRERDEARRRIVNMWTTNDRLCADLKTAERDRDAARADHARVRDECFAAHEASIAAEQRAEWKERAANDLGLDNIALTQTLRDLYDQGMPHLPDCFVRATGGPRIECVCAVERTRKVLAGRRDGPT